MNYSFFCVTILGLTLISQPVKAQFYAQANSGELPDNSQQMKSWQCVQEDQAITEGGAQRAIAVQAKDVNFWKPVIENDGWQCQEAVVDIQGNDRQFSCEPNEIIGILTVTWLQGNEGKQQMATWLDKIEKDSNLSCAVNKSSPYLAP